MLWKETAAVRLLSLRIPLLLFVGPRVLELDDEGAAVGVPLGWRTKNHVGSMYVGVMAAAADLASGMNAFSLIRSRHRTVVPVFKYANMEFLKRADGYTVFRTRQGRRIAEAMEETVRTVAPRFTSTSGRWPVTRTSFSWRTTTSWSVSSTRADWPAVTTTRSRVASA